MPITVIPTALDAVKIIEPSVSTDARGGFFEAFNARDFASGVGVTPIFVQENQSFSHRNVLRGLHYQVRRPQAKLVRVISGAVFDVVVDLRRASASFGQWIGTELSATNRRQLWIPEGFAHGFLVRSETAEVVYHVSDYWCPEHERCIAWNDPALSIAWPLTGPPLVADKDAAGVRWADAEPYASEAGCL